MFAPLCLLLLALALTLTGCDPAPAGPPPIVLISFDTLRADRLGAYGSQSPISPNLDRFASQAVVFENAYAQANETLFSHASLFTSRYASELGVMSYGFEFPKDVPTLAEVLRVYGYRCGASVAGGHLAPEFGLQRGFEVYQSAVNWGSLWHTVGPALGWLDGLAPDPAPPFLFLHGYDAHAPYLKPSPFGYGFADRQFPGPASFATRRPDGMLHIVDKDYFHKLDVTQLIDFSAPHLRARNARQAWLDALPSGEEDRLHLSNSDLDQLRLTYDGAVAWADYQFGLFMAGLADRGLLERAVIVVLADHGEELGEDGLFNHRFALSEESLHVPLMIRFPDQAYAGQRFSDVVALLDVMPTLLELAGASPPAGTQGHSLMPLIRGDGQAPRAFAFSEGVFRMISVARAGERLTYSGVGADSPYLEEMIATSSLDGPSFRSVPMLPSARREELRAQLLAWRHTLRRPEILEQQLSEESLKALRAQGYWEPQ